jgi:hypothetical protein
MADFDADIENWSFYADEPSTVECGPDSSVAHSGASSLRMDYAIAPENWVDCARYFDPPQDWSGSSGISLWLRSDAAAQEILFIVFVGDADNPTPFEIHFDTSAESAAGWAQFAFAWTDFEMADWADVSGGDQLNPAQVQSLVISPMSAETQIEGALWLDDLALVSGEAPPPPQAVAPTEEPAPAAPTKEPAATEPPPPTEKPDEEKESGGGGGLCGGTILPLGMAAVVLARKRR